MMFGDRAGARVLTLRPRALINAARVVARDHDINAARRARFQARHAVQRWHVEQWYELAEEIELVPQVIHEAAAAGPAQQRAAFSEHGAAECGGLRRKRPIRIGHLADADVIAHAPHEARDGA